jgi:hypothetical protein
MARKHQNNVAGLINCSLCSACCGIAYQLHSDDVQLLISGNGQLQLITGEWNVIINKDMLEKQGKWTEAKDVMFIRDENQMDVSIKKGKHWAKIASFTFFYLGKA